MTVRTISHPALEALCRVSSEAIVALDQHGQICLFNPAAAAAFNLSEADVVGHRLNDFPALQPLLSLHSQLVAGEQIVQAELTTPSCRVQLVSVPGQNEATVIPEMMREIIHDLKNPLAAVKSFIDLIRAAGPLAERQDTFAQRAQLSLMSTLNMIDELLDTAWMESNGTLRVIEVNFSNLVRHAVSQLDGYAQYRGIQIQVTLSSQDYILTGDERRLQSAIMNLVSNAIKYSPNGGPVNVTVSDNNHHIVFRVEDHGLGIAEEHLTRLFQRFYRVQTPETRRIDGTGLGLAIVKTIVEKHGGHVSVESVEGKGSVFGFSLPWDQSHAQ
jgi:signal transduction histidine kinase